MKLLTFLILALSIIAGSVCADPVTDALSTIAQQHQQDAATIQQQAATIAALKAAVPVVAPVKGWIGTNISNNSYAGTDAKWADITHQSTGWYNIALTPAAALLTDQWGGKTIAPAFFNPDGYPLCPAQADIYPTGYPVGDYTATWDGSGTISFGSAVKFTPGANANSGTITISNLTLPVRIAVSATDPKNPIRNLHIWCPGYGPGTANASLVFRKEYSALLGRFSCARSMDAQGENTNDDIHWSDRVTPTQWCQTGQQHGLQGMALEYIVAMANEAHVDLWVCIPINADADYVQHMAQICHGCNGKVHVEYGNEIWNITLGICARTIQKLADDPVGAFNYDGTITNGGITPYVDATGNRKLGTDSLTRAARCAVERARANAVIFRAAFADRPGALKCVWAGQSAWDAWAKNGLEWEAAKYGNTIFDELAIAPYFTFNWKPAYFPATGGTLDQIFAGVEKFCDNDLPGQLDSHATLAQKYGLKLVCYESGQSFWPGSDIQQQLNADPTGAKITDITYLAQLDPRMGAAYTKYMQALHDHGVGLNMNYSFIGSWNKFSYFCAWRSLADSNPRTVALLAEAARSN